MGRPLLLPLLLFIINFTPPSAARTGTDGCCRVYCCGNSIEIKHPFCASSQRETISTKPSTSHYDWTYLDIDCDEKGTAIARFVSNHHAIESIDYASRTIRLVDANALETCTTACPKLHANVSIERFPGLYYAPDVVNLTFFYDCNTSDLGDLPPKINHSRITCRLDGGNSSDPRNASYVFDDKEKIDESLYVHCNSVVVAPVRKKELERSINVQKSPGEVLRQGFSLRWKEKYGRRRQNGLMSESVCGGERKRDNLDMKYKAIIAACSSFTGLVLASVCSVAWLRHRRKRRRISSLTKTPRSASSVVDPESLGVHYYRTCIFSYGELKDATDGFAAVNELGDGGFGTVYKGKLQDGRVVAVKRLYEKSYKRVERFMNEVRILSLLRHENLVTLYGCTSRHSRELLLVYEFVPNGTVADHLHGSRADERALTWPVRLNIAVETAGALAYLHAIEPQIIHRDVKTNNILLDGDFRVKVADFGLSRSSSPEDSHVSTLPQGTPGYVDPEYHWSCKLTDKSDVYSFGVVLVELMSSMLPIDIGRHAHEVSLANLAVSKIQSGLLGELVDKTLGFGSDEKVTMMVESVAELAFRCLQAEKEMRPTMDEVLQTLEEVASRDQEYRESFPFSFP